MENGGNPAIDPYSAFDVPDVKPSMDDKEQRYSDKCLPGYDVPPATMVDSTSIDVTREVKLDAISHSPPSSENKSVPKESEGIVPDGFVPDQLNVEQPNMYTKAGKVINGEWLGGVFIRYKKYQPSSRIYHC